MDQMWGVEEGELEDHRGFSSEHLKTDALTYSHKSLNGRDTFCEMHF